MGHVASGDERAMFTGRSAATHMPSQKQRCRGLVLFTMFGERRRAKWHKDWRREAGRKRGREDRDILMSQGEEGWREGWRHVSVHSKLKGCMHSYYTSCYEDKCCRWTMEFLLRRPKNCPECLQCLQEFATIHANSGRQGSSETCMWCEVWLLRGLVCHCSLLNWSSYHRGANWRGITSMGLDGMLATDTEVWLLQL